MEEGLEGGRGKEHKTLFRPLRDKPQILSGIPVYEIRVDLRKQLDCVRSGGLYMRIEIF